ncbi:DUF4931 domain-containing protein [Candidatus Micrarchaeota archaeon]|nr:DUF4931 domain-containing protein [Candidatus Micrarchaeota archaeon]
MFALDAIHGTRVAYSQSRSKRPHKPKNCLFCPGAEHLTPPATLVLPGAKNWRVRCFPNKFPVVESPNGFHEVIVETAGHDAWEDFPESQLALVFQAYQNRFRALLENKNAKYVLLFKNFGDKSGASIDHEHAQILSFPFIPKLVQSELHAGPSTFKKMLKQPAVLESEHFKAVCPPVSRFPWETWILSNDENLRFEDMNEKQGLEFMLVLREIIRKIKTLSWDYTVAFHVAPKNKKLWFHVEVLPRKAVWGGVELGAGVIVNFKKPRDALRDLRSA